MTIPTMQPSAFQRQTATNYRTAANERPKSIMGSKDNPSLLVQITDEQRKPTCPTCHGTGLMTPPLKAKADGSINAAQIAKVPCNNPDCTFRAKEVLGSREFYALQRKDVKLSEVQATISAVPLQSAREEILITVTVCNVAAKDLLDQAWEAAHQSLREYQKMFITTLEIDGNTYRFKKQERPECGRLTTELKEASAMNKTELEQFFSDDDVKAVVGDKSAPIAPPSNETKPDAVITPVPTIPKSPDGFSAAENKKFVTDLLDDFDVWGEFTGVEDWLNHRNLNLLSDRPALDKAVIDAFKAELRIELERAGLKPTQTTIFGLFGVNLVEDALKTFKPDDVRKKVKTYTDGELKRRQQEQDNAAAQEKIAANQNAPLTNIIPPPVQSNALSIPRPNVNPTVFGTGDPKFDLMVTQAQVLLESKFLPTQFKTVQQVIAVGMMGDALGLPMIIALNQLYVVNNRIGMLAQLMMGLCRQKGVLETLDITDDGSTCSVTVKRVGEQPYTSKFSMDDARKLTTTETEWINDKPIKKTIQLSEKKNWREQPEVMRRWRAISAAMRIIFPDVILGMYTPEELEASIDDDIVIEKAVA